MSYSENKRSTANKSINLIIGELYYESNNCKCYN